MKKLTNRAESFLGVDIDGDGAVGGVPGKVVEEIAVLKEENRRMYHALTQVLPPPNGEPTARPQQPRPSQSQPTTSTITHTIT